MPSLGLVAPRLTHPNSLGIIRPTKHFIRGIPIPRIQTQRVSGHLNIRNLACIAGSIGKARVARHDAFVVARSGAPLAGGAGVGLNVGKGGAAEELVFDVGDVGGLGGCECW